MPHLGPEHANVKVSQSDSAYHTFVRENIKKHGDDMKAVAAAYRAQKGGGEAAPKAERL